jgi:hypothetical protein
MNAKYKLLIILSSIIFTISCEVSPLSDVEITDPTILNAEVSINQDNYNNKTVSIRFLDKNGESVKLKNGYVKINNDVCGFKFNGSNGWFSQSYYYNISNFEDEFIVKIQFSSDVTNNYIFEIDKNVYPGFYINSVNNYGGNYNKLYGTSHIKNAPFRNGMVDVEYNLLVNY